VASPVVVGVVAVSVAVSVAGEGVVVSVAGVSVVVPAVSVPAVLVAAVSVGDAFVYIPVSITQKQDRNTPMLRTAPPSPSVETSIPWPKDL